MRKCVALREMYEPVVLDLDLCLCLNRPLLNCQEKLYYTFYIVISLVKCKITLRADPTLPFVTTLLLQNVPCKISGVS